MLSRWPRVTANIRGVLGMDGRRVNYLPNTLPSAPYSPYLPRGSNSSLSCSLLARRESSSWYLFSHTRRCTGRDEEEEGGGGEDEAAEASAMVKTGEWVWPQYTDLYTAQSLDSPYTLFVSFPLSSYRKPDPEVTVGVFLYRTVEVSPD